MYLICLGGQCWASAWFISNKLPTVEMILKIIKGRPPRDQQRFAELIEHLKPEHTVEGYHILKECEATIQIVKVPYVEAP